MCVCIYISYRRKKTSSVNMCGRMLFEADVWWCVQSAQRCVVYRVLVGEELTWSSLPGRQTAGSSISGLLEAPIQTTFLRAPTPSISVRIWFTIRSPASPDEPPEPRGLAMESISSKKRMQGAAPRALAKRLRTCRTKMLRLVCVSVCERAGERGHLW